MDPIGWSQGKYTSQTRKPGSTPTSIAINRPSTMPHQEFVNLTKEQRRQISHSNDIKIKSPSHAELNIRYWQANYKVADHGAIHGLPFQTKPNGGFIRTSL
jgi:hypothetical protein